MPLKLIKKVGMRLPDDLHAELVRLAQQEQRSLHGEIIHILYERLKATAQPKRAA